MPQLCETDLIRQAAFLPWAVRVSADNTYTPAYVHLYVFTFHWPREYILKISIRT